MRKLAFVGLFMLGSCSLGPYGLNGLDNSVQSFVTPDGKSASLIHCGGPDLTIATCQERARALCGGDYSEINRSITVRAKPGGWTPASENRSIEVVCKT